MYVYYIIHVSIFAEKRSMSFDREGEETSIIDLIAQIRRRTCNSGHGWGAGRGEGVKGEAGGQ